MILEMDGVRVALERHGTGSRTVLFVHGLGASRACFEGAERFFDPDLHTLLLPDLPGFGESTAPEGFDYSMASLAAVLDKALARLGADEVHLCAHSMGGAVALLLAGSAGVRVRSFACAEGNLVESDAFMSSKVARFGEKTFERVVSKWLHMVEESLGPAPSRSHHAFLASLRATPPSVLHRASVSCWELTRSGELGRRFLGLTCPRLYLVGSETVEARGIPAPVVEAGVPIVTIQDAGHFVMERADAFFPAVRDLVDAA